MKYLLTLYDAEPGADTGPEDFEAIMAEYYAFNAVLDAANANWSGEALETSDQSAHALTRDGKMLIQDGPYTDSKEQLGGFYLIEAPDLDAALDLAAQCPCAKTGTVEVRPLWDIDG